MSLSNLDDKITAEDLLALNLASADTVGRLSSSGNRYFLPASNGADDAAAINAILANGGQIAGKRGESYVIGSSLVIPSNTKLDLTGCTVTLNASSNCNMIHNQAWVNGSGRDSNIEIVGGTWARGANAGTGQQLHSILMQRVDQLSIHDLSVTSSAGKYAISVYACTNFAVERITFNVASDGVHIEGASSSGLVKDIYGTTGDDTVAVTPVNFAAIQNSDFGNCTDIRIEGVYTTTSQNGVKILSGSNGGTGYDSKRIWVKNVNVNANSNAVFIGGDSAQATTYGGNIIDIEVDGVTNRSLTGANIYLYGVGSGKLIDNVSFKRVADTLGGAVIFYTAGGVANTVGTVTFSECRFDVAGVTVDVGAIVNNMTFKDCHFELPAGSYTCVLKGTSSQIGTLRYDGCKLNVATATGGLVQAGVSGATCTLTDVFVTDLTVGQCAWAVGDFGSGVTSTINMYVSNVHKTGSGNLINLRASTTMVIQRIESVVNGGSVSSAGTLTYGASTVNGTTTTTAPVAGGAGALPATPAGYVSVTVDGTARQIAYY